MFKAEMTEKQLADRDVFVRKLTAVGWDPRGWEQLFDSGANLTPEAQAEYKNATFEMRLGYYIGENYVSLELARIHNRTNIRLRFCLKDNLAVIVDAVAEVQDTVSQDNYVDFIQKMVLLCDPLLLETPQGLVKVS